MTRTNDDRKRAIVVLSIGDQPWFEFNRPFFEAYARRVGASLRVAGGKTLSSHEDERLKFFGGRSLKVRCNMLKVLYFRDALRAYDDVLLFDDTCFITPHCPDLFEVPSNAPMAAVKVASGADAEPVFNMGVVRGRASLRPFLEDLENEYERQGHPRHEGLLFNAAIRAGRLACDDLDPRFNRVGSDIATAGLDGIDAWIYHLTTFLHDRERLDLAQQLSSRFSKTRAGWTPPSVMPDPVIHAQQDER